MFLRWTSRGTRMAADEDGLDCGAVRLGRLPPQHPENVGTLNSREGCHCQATGVLFISIHECNTIKGCGYTHANTSTYAR